MLIPFKSQIASITSDNGTEFAEHELISKKLNAEFFFAHPYSSWERGLSENTNGLIRQYFPKGMDLRELTNKDLKLVQDKLNSRPIKTLDFKSPKELFLKVS